MFIQEIWGWLGVRMIAKYTTLFQAHNQWLMHATVKANVLTKNFKLGSAECAIAQSKKLHKLRLSGIKYCSST